MAIVNAAQGGRHNALHTPAWHGAYIGPPTVEPSRSSRRCNNEEPMRQQIPEGTLVVVADGGSARVFTNVGSDHALVLRQHEELQIQALTEQGVSGQGPSGAMPNDMSQSQLNEATFAKQLAEQLNEDALNNRYAHLVLVADPQTLGRIRPLLHKQTQQRLLKDLAKDLTNSPLEDIQRALAS
jgi:protein required for attachment to host cells